jgi:hypothetical protein
MCDYSLHSVRTRPVKVGDKLVTRDFGTGTRGFASVDDLGTAVCVLPGTELAFADDVTYRDWNIRSIIKARLAVRIHARHRMAIFRQINKEEMTHHDALEFPDGQVVLLTRLSVDQEAIVLQLQLCRVPSSKRGNESRRRSSPKGKHSKRLSGRSRFRERHRFLRKSVSCSFRDLQLESVGPYPAAPLAPRPLQVAGRRSCGTVSTVAAPEAIIAHRRQRA